MTRKSQCHENVSVKNPPSVGPRVDARLKMTEMIAMPILGLATSVMEDEGVWKMFATVHLVTGYTTFAAVSTAAALMVF